MTRPRDYELTFSGAGERELQASGRFLRVLSAPVAAVFVAADGGSELERGAGQTLYDADGFTRVRVRSTVAQTVKINVAQERQDDNSAAVSVSVTANVTPAPVLDAGGDVSIAATSSALLAAGDPNRLFVTVANPATNTDPVRVGGAGVGAASGVELQPGDAITLATTAAVHGYNPKASAQTVQVLTGGS